MIMWDNYDETHTAHRIRKPGNRLTKQAALTDKISTQGNIVILFFTSMLIFNARYLSLLHYISDEHVIMKRQCSFPRFWELEYTMGIRYRCLLKKEKKEYKNCLFSNIWPHGPRPVFISLIKYELMTVYNYINRFNIIQIVILVDNI